MLLLRANLHRKLRQILFDLLILRRLLARAQKLCRPRPAQPHSVKIDDKVSTTPTTRTRGGLEQVPRLVNKHRGVRTVGRVQKPGRVDAPDHITRVGSRPSGDRIGTEHLRDERRGEDDLVVRVTVLKVTAHVRLQRRVGESSCEVRLVGRDVLEQPAHVSTGLRAAGDSGGCVVSRPVEHGLVDLPLVLHTLLETLTIDDRSAILLGGDQGLRKRERAAEDLGVRLFH